MANLMPTVTATLAAGRRVPTPDGDQPGATVEREVLAELRDALAREDGAAVRRLADGYGPRLERPERRRRGAFATPPDLAAALARHALPAPPAHLPTPAVVDPACGPGALLRAAFAR